MLFFLQDEDCRFRQTVHSRAELWHRRAGLDSAWLIGTYEDKDDLSCSKLVYCRQEAVHAEYIYSFTYKTKQTQALKQ